MKSVYNFVVKPKGKRYNNTKKVGDSELIINTEIFNLFSIVISFTFWFYNKVVNAFH